MKALWTNPDYRRLFAAQVVALSGTGLMTVALGLLAYDLAQERAGVVLGLVYTIKMIAYVGLSPLAQAWAARLPRKAVLIGADLLRAGAALCLPFVTEVWQVLALIFVLQAASATFTPAYQATLPDVLPDEADYTRALSLSRLAYDLENLTSPALAGLLLLFVPFSGLFAGTMIGFLVSAWLVWRSHLNAPDPKAEHRPFRERLTRGLRLYLATPRLRGLLALNFTAAAMGAFVLVNTVVLVRASYGAGESALALAMACFGAGSMAAALLLPRVLERTGDRAVMVRAAVALVGLGGVAGAGLYLGLPPVWAGLAGLALAGALYSAILTPSGRLIRRSAGAEDRPALFAAQFALSHACWLVTYPLAGWAGQALGLGAALVLLAALGACALVVALRVWPGNETPPDMDKTARM